MTISHGRRIFGPRKHAWLKEIDRRVPSAIWRRIEEIRGYNRLWYRRLSRLLIHFVPATAAKRKAVGCAGRRLL